jgi:hypothetical protein
MTTNISGKVAIGFRHLTFMAQIDPALLENAFYFRFENTLIGIDRAVHPEDTFIDTVVDKGPQSTFLKRSIHFG